MSLCECGCGQEANHGKRFIHGHNKATLGKHLSQEHKTKISKTRTGATLSDDHKAALVKGANHDALTIEHRTKLSISNSGKKRSDTTRQHISAGKQGISYKEWNRFVANDPYCEKFDEACRERVRAQYDYKCFICDLPQDENIDKNNKPWKLSVHHVDRNKNQGCDGHEFNLIPLCSRCHPKAHYDPLKHRLIYLSKNIDKL